MLNEIGRALLLIIQISGLATLTTRGNMQTQFRRSNKIERI